jgi:hypothetical protein
VFDLVQPANATAPPAGGPIDANGNLTGDGTKTYAWNARNQLAGISGGVTAGFTYRADGQRASRTVSGTTTGFLYDGLNPVQELSGAMPTATLSIVARVSPDLVVGVVLHRLPQLEVFVADEGMDQVSEGARQALETDHFLDVAEILQTMRRRHAGRELELDERRKREKRHARSALRRGCRIGEGDRLRLPVTRVLPRKNDVDIDAVLDIPHAATSSGPLHVPSAEHRLLEGGEAFGREKDIHIDSCPLIPEFVQGQCVDVA